MTTEKIVIDKARALELLDKVVKGREDFRYWDQFEEAPDSVCRYVENGKPACLIGVALYEAGVPLHVLEDMDGYGGILNAFPAFEHLVDIAPEAADLFADAQNVQDDDRSWGEAVRAARGEA